MSPIPRPADFLLVNEFPIGSPVWQAWGSMGWVPRVVVEHRGPWVITRGDNHGTLIDQRISKTFPRHHLLRHRVAGMERPMEPPYIRLKVESIEGHYAVANTSGRVVGWYPTEAEAVRAARDLARTEIDPVHILRPHRAFQRQQPPVEEIKPIRRARA